MNIIDCAMMEDLLPLYVEQIVSDSSKAAIEEHIDSCQKCADVLASMKQELCIPADIDKQLIGNLKKKIGKKQIGIAIMSGLLVILIGWLSFMILNIPIPVKYSQNLFNVTENEEGSIIFNYSDKIGLSTMAGGGKEITISCWTSLWKSMTNGRITKSIIFSDSDTRVKGQKIYYKYPEDTGTKGVLIYDANNYKSQNSVENKKPLQKSLYGYGWISLILSVVGIICCLVIRKRDIHKMSLKIMLLPVCYMISSCFVLIGKGEIYDNFYFRYYSYSIWMVTLVLYLILYFILFRFRIEKRI